MIRVEVNGQQQDIQPGTSLTALLSLLNVTPERVAVELNLTVIDRKQLDCVSLKAGDHIEIISFVGGGRN